jgi:hypothetical protein
MNKEIDVNNEIKILKRNSLLSVITNKTINTESTPHSILNDSNQNTGKFDNINVIRNVEAVNSETPKKKTLSYCISSFFKKFKIANIPEVKNAIKKQNKNQQKEISINQKSFKEREKSHKEQIKKIERIESINKRNKEECKRVVMVESINESTYSNCNSRTNSVKYDLSEILKDESLKCKNMNQELKDIIKDDLHNNIKFNIDNNEQNDIIDLVDDWSKPPETYGLENSDRIFGQYYLTNKNLNGKIFHIDFLYTIMDDIRNFRKLSKYQLSFIRNVDPETKSVIINEFNNALEVLVSSY